MRYIIVNDKDYEEALVLLEQNNIDYDIEYHVWDLAFKNLIRSKYPDLNDDYIASMASNLADDPYLFEEIDRVIDNEYDMFMSEVN